MTAGGFRTRSTRSDSTIAVIGETGYLVAERCRRAIAKAIYVTLRADRDQENAAEKQAR